MQLWLNQIIKNHQFINLSIHPFGTCSLLKSAVWAPTMNYPLTMNDFYKFFLTLRLALRSVHLRGISVEGLFRLKFCCKIVYPFIEHYLLPMTQ